MDQKKQTKNILKKCVNDILKECGIYTNNIIDAIVTRALDDIDKIKEESDNDDIYNGMEIGKCCFCEGDCNPQSQSCGLCTRGLSGVAIGLPVPNHLQKFL